MLSAICLNLDQSKILSSGDGLRVKNNRGSIRLYQLHAASCTEMAGPVIKTWASIDVHQTPSCQGIA